jgi:hypothetical protein
MKNGYTRIGFLLDRSGSMDTCREATVAAINSFVREQRALPGEVKMKLVQFDDFYEIAFDKDLRDIGEFTQLNFQPRGWTALYDAQCRAIDELGAELAALPEAERPERVIVVTMTDGLENRSKHYTLSDVNKRIKTQETQFNWAFLYLGANQDAVRVGLDLGMHRGQTITYNVSAQGMANTMAATNHYVGALRSFHGQSADISFSEEDRLAAMAGDAQPVGATKAEEAQPVGATR